MFQLENDETRNNQAKSITQQLINNITLFPLTENEVSENYNANLMVEKFVPIKQMGFRGVVLTTIVGKILNPGISPFIDFYECSPRAIFEKGIYYALREARIPCGQSDPLNVAKNTQILDHNWARGKRPETAAIAASDFLRILMEAWNNEGKREALIRIFMDKLMKYANEVQSFNHPLLIEEFELPIQTAKKLARFAINCPESGTIPQFIVGNLIKLSRELNGNLISVCGVEESVFGTNRTSKKPADIWEQHADGTYGNLYEITVKTVDQKRIEDCFSTLSSLGQSRAIVTFICNMPSNISTLHTTEDTAFYESVGFQFIDIADYIKTTFSTLGANNQTIFMEKLQNFIFDDRRPVETKKYWSKYFSS